jgi:hypothetical protein
MSKTSSRQRQDEAGFNTPICRTYELSFFQMQGLSTRTRAFACTIILLARSQMNNNRQKPSSRWIQAKAIAV